MAVY
jgi:hypothetical protein